MSRVIRHGRPRVAKRDELAADERGRAIVEDAEARAQEIIATAEERGVALLAASKREGVAAGHAEVASEIAAAAEERARLLSESEDEIARLSIAIAQRVVAKELETAPETIQGIVAEMLERAKRASSVTVLVAAGDVAAASALPNVEVRVDPELTLGDCTLVTDLGRFDGRVNQKLVALLDALKARG